MGEYFDVFDTPLGILFCLVQEERIALLHPNASLLPPTATKTPHPLLQECKAQIHAYFSKQLTRFELPLKSPQSNFSQCVMETLLDIPYGETKSYANLAWMCGFPKAYRAVGSALASNPLLLLLPCHRIIHSNGKLGNYAWGENRKKILIDLEKSKS